MNQFISILILLLNIVVLTVYLFATVFGIGVHAHETLSHRHDGIEEHSHQLVLHAHNNLGCSDTTQSVVAEDHEHDVPMVQLSGVCNSSANQKYSADTPSIVSVTVELFSVYCNDCFIAEILPDASPPLLYHVRSNLTGRAPPAA